MVLLEHRAQVGQRLAALVQQRQHALPDAHVAHQPQVADDQCALRSWHRGGLLKRCYLRMINTHVTYWTQVANDLCALRRIVNVSIIKTDRLFDFRLKASTKGKSSLWHNAELDAEGAA